MRADAQRAKIFSARFDRGAMKIFHFFSQARDETRRCVGVIVQKLSRCFGRRQAFADPKIGFRSAAESARFTEIAKRV